MGGGEGGGRQARSTYILRHGADARRKGGGGSQPPPHRGSSGRCVRAWPRPLGVGSSGVEQAGRRSVPGAAASLAAAPPPAAHQRPLSSGISSSSHRPAALARRLWRRQHSCAPSRRSAPSRRFCCRCRCRCRCHRSPGSRGPGRHPSPPCCPRRRSTAAAASLPRGPGWGRGSEGRADWRLCAPRPQRGQRSAATCRR